MEVSTEDFVKIIGEQQVEIRIMRQDLNKTLVANKMLIEANESLVKRVEELTPKQLLDRPLQAVK